ncbi:MAG: HAD-IA family hydrolase [Acidobacteria bacterium]|nr:HAD-IA family hydrolase [Acidobacteriota bacterium]
MKVLSMRLFVFDMVGTTIQDDGQIAVAFEQALRGCGVALHVGALDRVRGLSKREAIRTLLVAGGVEAGLDEETTKVFADFRARLIESCASTPLREVPGAMRTLRWLRERGVKVALNTGLDHAIADAMLQQLHWDEGVYDVLVTSDDVIHGRPSPDLIIEACARSGVTDRSEVAVVGDTAPDITAGRAAGAGLVVGVLSGAHSRDQLERAGADLLLESVEQIPSLL